MASRPVDATPLRAVDQQAEGNLASSLCAFLEDAARKVEAANIMFEQRLFDLVGVLRQISDALASKAIPYEVIGSAFGATCCPLAMAIPPGLWSAEIHWR